MLSREENELICRTGPGTPMGDLFRRFWLPVALAEELPGPDCDPVRAGARRTPRPVPGHPGAPWPGGCLFPSRALVLWPQ